jgi:hypothetical protein
MMMMTARTGTVSRTNRLKMLGFSRKLGRKGVVIRPASLPADIVQQA